MKVIVVSGKAFSGGDSFAKALAERLGYRLIDADVVVERAAAYGPGHDELNDALHRPPRVRDRFLRKRQRNLMVLQSALAQELGFGEVVCQGNLGYFLLGLNDCLRIRIEASPDFRVQAVCDRLRLSREEAVDHIDREDRNTERWLRDVCGRDAPGDSDIVLDLERIEVQDACELATCLIHSQSRLRSSRSNTSALNDFALSCRMQAALVMAPNTASLELDAFAQAGVVSLSGMVRTPEQLSGVQSVGWSVPAIAGLILNGMALQQPAVATDDPVRAHTEKRKRASPMWHLPQPAWVQIGLVLALTIAGSWSLSELGSRITANLLPRDDARGFVGTITDTTCGPKSMDAQCVRNCVRSGAKYALYDGQKLYNLTDQETADRYAAQKVRITGTLDATANALKVDSMQPIS